MKTVSRIFALVLFGAILGFLLGIYQVQREFIDNEKALGVVDDYAKTSSIANSLLA